MPSMIRTFALATMLLAGSVAAYATASDHSSNRQTLKIEKDKKAKDKDKDRSIDGARVPVAVPDGDPPIALLLAIGAVALLALRQRTAQKS